MRVFFSVGDPSGDIHAANLIRELKRRRPDVDCFGFGGPKMTAAGCELLYPLVDDPIMMFGKAIIQIPHYLRQLRNAVRLWQTRRPDVVVLVDYPGFNWHVAKAAKKLGIPVAYHLPPQIWSWASWRVRKMRRFVDRIFCSLPFEETWYCERGIDYSEYHGHPFYDDLGQRRLDEHFVASLRSTNQPLLALLPGSRTMEVERNIDQIVCAAGQVQRQTKPRLCVAAFKEAHRPRIEAALKKHGVTADVFVGKTPEIIASAAAAISVSGSVSLELLYYRVPTAIVYYAGPLLYHISGPLLVHTPFITLVNLLACRSVYPEFIGYRDQSAAIAEHVAGWIGDEQKRSEIVGFLDRLSQLYCRPGATAAVAERLMEFESGRRELKLAG